MSLPSLTALEAALADYLRTLTFDGRSVADFPARFLGDAGTAVPLRVHAICGALDPETGELPEEWGQLVLPALVASALRSEGETFDLCDVTLTLLSSPDEIEAPARIEERFKWLLQIFDDDNAEDVAAGITEASDDVHVIGLVLTGKDAQDNGRHVVRTIALRVTATRKS